MPKIEDEFWGHVQKSDNCWLWIGDRFKEGYGRIRINGKPTRTNRVVWELLYESIPEGMEVCHTCDNPPCVRPEHLFLGTHEENMKDMARKGRSSRCRTRHAKLTEENVEEIKNQLKSYKWGMCAELSRKYGVTKEAIIHIKQKRRWY